ncbi:Pyridine nucleotide-disulphide oxidoreductase [Salinimicrobium catena]|uniref:Pyridine nucleotide-disulphide oxidoreductase n=1 Tax=Salinimicrobium catena TaxID=390640 RepID=A0A1H5JWN5_9FLAO|nr:NAD(P)/FAD-dependent oxidoreductase [Salinimicrobium catena]SDK91026.1 Pyridine nucleotide-disulphide oxidoreductase [Salinimicrobium catena]SEE56687.1 Pyridine nucleotide-disulphide oxidoreductase [Salinimicrobium catena]
MQEHVVIIGNGIAGITAARHIRRISEKKITVISSENKYFFSRTALMYFYMGHMKWEHLEPYEDWFWEKNRIDLKLAYVEKIDPEAKTLFLAGNEKLPYDQLIIATGSIPRKLGWEGQDLQGVQGLVSKQDLELLEKNTKNCRHATIVGGGLIGVELAEMLHTRNIPVTMLIREDSFWRNVLPQKDSEFVARHISSHGIGLRNMTELESISGKNKVTSVTTKKGDQIETDLVGLTVGVQPNIAFLKGSGIETDVGILVDPYLKTNIESIYSIGDCAQQREPKPGRRPIEAVWYTARMMGETVAQTICGNPFKYNPGNWFNSAKFFEIEYQTYGNVSATPPENEQQLHWEHRDGKKAVTLAFEKGSGRFLGINSFGIRMKHEVFDRWLTEQRPIEHVLKHLEEANFDPEFFKRHHKEILHSFKDDLMNPSKPKPQI